MSERRRAGFFTEHRPDRPGLAVFLNAGDPGLDRLPELVSMLDEQRVDCLELAVPFPNSPTDGPVIRRSAHRALAAGVDRPAVLTALAGTPRPAHLRIALLVDWAHSIRGERLPDVLGAVSESDVDALLVHGLPMVLREEYHRTTTDLGLPIVTTCYPRSAPEVLIDSARHASAYLYLVAHYQRSGTPSEDGYNHLAGTIDRIRKHGDAPIAVGFGIRTAADVAAVAACGADAAVIGSAVVAEVENAQQHGRDEVAAIATFIEQIRKN